jgi:hypothetical protein
MLLRITSRWEAVPALLEEARTAEQSSPMWISFISALSRIDPEAVKKAVEQR